MAAQDTDGCLLFSHLDVTIRGRVKKALCIHALLAIPDQNTLPRLPSARGHRQDNLPGSEAHPKTEGLPRLPGRTFGLSPSMCVTPCAIQEPLGDCPTWR